jgi:diguanylate cyclase (GGDEF)-like protein
MAIFTRRDVLRYTAGRMLVAVSLAAVLTWTLASLYFGTDPQLNVTVGSVVSSAITIAIVISALVTAGLSYRSGLLMRQLSHARVELARLAATDSLTGLLNRRGFDEAAGIAHSQARKSDSNIAALVCDIDRFKSINDRFGHDVGDLVLQRIGGLLGDFASGRRLVAARHGGEEFVVFMTGASRQMAAQYAEDLRKTCEGMELIVGDDKVRVTVSIGFATAPASNDFSGLMRAADTALYAAKHRGRNRIAEAFDNRPSPMAA